MVFFIAAALFITVTVIVADVKDDVIILDANHFLAGQELVFDIELVEIAE